MTLVHRVWALLDPPARKRIVLSVLGSFALALLDTVAVLLVYPLLQTLVGSTDDLAGLGFVDRLAENEPAVLAAIVAGLLVLKSALAIGFLRWNLGFVLRAETSVAVRLYDGYLQTAPAAASVIDTAAVQRTLTESLRRVFHDGLAYALPAIADRLLIALLCVGVLVVVPFEGLVALGVFGLAALGYRWMIHSRTTRAGSALHHESQRALRLTAETLRSSREIALSRTRDEFVRMFTASRDQMRQAQRTIAVNEQLPRYYLESTLVVCTAAVAAVSFSLEDSGDAVATVGLLAAVGFRVLPSLNRALLASSRARTALPGLDQIFGDLRALSGSDGIDGSPALHEPVTAVTGHGVTVRFPDRDAPVLSDVDFSLEPGEALGILGSSGVGKTTLVSAMLGFCSLEGGEIVINGTHRVTGPAAWAGRAAYVPQQVVILDDTLERNVAFGVSASRINKDRVLEAVHAAHLDELLPTLPRGLQTDLGEEGSRLSGGQRQRLGLARAIYYDSDLLVLDEATAGLDRETEHRVLDTLTELKVGRCVVIVSHHPAVIDWCDRLIILEDGRVAADGSARDLRATLENSHIVD